jgi:spore coat protein A, manganese oxidase
MACAFPSQLRRALHAQESNGSAQAWYLPDAANIDPTFAKVGSLYNIFKTKSEGILGQMWDPGTAVFQYANDQRATTLWYHDHTLGKPRLNAYAGPAGFYILTGRPRRPQERRTPGASAGTAQ